MEQGNYIVLRDINRVDLSDPYSGGALYGGRSVLGTLASGGLRLELEALNKREMAERRRDPAVISIAPPMPVSLIKPEAVEEAAAPEEGATWGVLVTGALESPYVGKGVTVAVLDTGIDANHEAFRGLEIVQRDFTGEGNGDEQGHGTHCAGTICGQSTNGLRFGVAPGIDRLLVGKILDSTGAGTTAQICQGIQWALDQGAHVISMSIGISFPQAVDMLLKQGYPSDLATSLALEDYRANLRLFESLAALARARAAFFQGTLLIAAAGNASKRNVNPQYELAVEPPAAADGIISVGALATVGAPHDALSVAYFSNTGPNICGPGVNVYSAQAGGGYVAFSGTSMATPHVVGVAALWAEKLIAEAGTFNTIELSARLIGQASKERLAAGVDPMDIGAGLVQAPTE